MTLVEFLLQRIAEDEAAAGRGRRHNARETYANDNYGYLLVDPQRVLAECEAKRGAVREYIAEAHRGPAGDRSDFVARHGGILDAYAAALRMLAATYADHPDYDETWRP